MDHWSHLIMHSKQMMKGRGGPNTVTLITRHHADSESVMAVITNDNIHSFERTWWRRDPAPGGYQYYLQLGTNATTIHRFSSGSKSTSASACVPLCVCAWACALACEYSWFLALLECLKHQSAVVQQLPLTSTLMGHLENYPAAGRC